MRDVTRKGQPMEESSQRVSGRWRLLIAALLILGIALLAHATALPSLEGRRESRANVETADTRLGRGIEPRAAAHPGFSGVRALRDAHEAFAARVLLARAADRTLDVQYYIWRNDLTGTLLFEELHAAAERGVRVRLLLDDLNTTRLDPLLAALDAHPNIEVRLFNPFALRRPRTLNFLTDLPRLNRRMHNKSFTADSQATIIGGRNVGDAYFGATDGVLFADLDVVALGKVVPEVSRDFDAYWASEAAFPVDRLLPAASEKSLEALRAPAVDLRRSPEAERYMRAVRETPLVQKLLDRTLVMEWAETHLVSDDPGKVLGAAARETNLAPQLAARIGVPSRRLTLVSPYFVPGEAGVAWLTGLARQGVRVEVLTNSLEATDVAAVQSGYARRRKPLLEGGVRLFELKRLGAGVGPASGPWGSSGSSLHAKTFAVDGLRLFIGSFNFDPRSANLNTEMGFVIESPLLAGQLDTLFEKAIPRSSYEVRLAEDGELTWIERVADGERVHGTEPGTSFWQRAGIAILSLLPIEWLL